MIVVIGVLISSHVTPRERVRRVSQPRFIDITPKLDINASPNFHPSFVKMSPLHFNRISLQLFNETLARYPDTAPSTLKELDTLRYETIPEKLAKTTNDFHLIKADVEKLVEWKL